MTSQVPSAHIDFEADAAYLSLSPNAVASSRALGASVNVDLDEFDMVVGVELLNARAIVPVDQLTREFHVPEASVALLKQMQNAVLTFSAEGTSSMESTNGLLPA